MKISAITQRVTIILSLFVIMLASHAQQTAQKFILETNYLLSLPEGYDQDTAKRWPLLIFLHGSGEAGYDLNKVKVHGPPKLAEKGKKFPFIIVSPQAWPNTGWDTEHLYRLLQHIKQTQRVDNRKIYLTGLSMGGYGSWNFASKHPEELAAIAPVCGGGDSTEAWRLRYIPIWNFHGAKDDVVLPEQSEKMVIAARRYNPNVRYTLYPNANHNSWDLTYDNDSLYQWLLAQSKFSYKEVPMPGDKLKQYIGTYIGRTNDTVTIVTENDKLIIISGRERIPLKAFSDDMFFIEPDDPLEIRFERNKTLINAFIFMGNHKELYRRVIKK